MVANINGPYFYPLLDQDRYKAKIQFQALKVNPPRFKEDVVLAAVKSFEGLTNLDREDREKDLQQIGKEVVQISKKNKRQNSMNISPIDGERATIYLPISIQFDDRLQYNTPALDVVGATALAGINQGSGFLASAVEGITKGFSSITDVLQGNFTAATAGLAAYRAAKAFPFIPDSLRNAISVAARVSLNPNTVAAFSSVGVRTFSFQFKFIAKSKDEAEEVKKIIYFFRKNAYPEKFAGVVAYKFPNMFRIRMLYENPTGRTPNQVPFKSIGTGILDSYLQSVTTNYNPTTMAYHPDGEPVEIDLTLNFIEHRTLHKDDIKYEADVYSYPETNFHSLDLT